MAQGCQTGGSSAIPGRVCKYFSPLAADDTSRFYRVLERLPRFVIRVNARVICVVSPALSVDARGNWG
jgi:hypothetical protein